MASPSPYLFIATPSYNGQITYEYFHSFLQLNLLLNQHQIPYGVAFSCHDSLVTRARNTLVAYFLRDTQATHLMFIDTDIGYEAADVLKLLHHNQDIVTGVYPKKILDWENIASSQADNPQATEQAGAVFGVNLLNRGQPTHQPIYKTKGPLVEALDADTGFMLIKRQVIEKIIKHHPELHYQFVKNLDPTLAPHIFNLFHPIIDPKDNRYLSEDFAFCRLWQNLGGKVWIDPTIKLTHTGTYTFSGDYSQFFQAHTKKV